MRAAGNSHAFVGTARAQSSRFAGDAHPRCWHRGGSCPSAVVCVRDSPSTHPTRGGRTRGPVGPPPSTQPWADHPPRLTRPTALPIVRATGP
ncbi:hypothetical protein DB30_03750 [Enhygromyxa salina]|uniref:Uncharacterized protein n=1 Tax=Enhygromyxa salina TaxID=215803 RepID=A0A0C2A177_9BACT|nr:hypothetical protein DB30_03750 [Enhygromyxa salina]